MKTTALAFMKVACVSTLLALMSSETPGVAQEVNPSTDSSTLVRAFVTNFGGDGVSVVEPGNGRLIAHIKTGSKPHGVAIAPDGDAVYVSNEGDGTLSIINPLKNEVVATIEVGKTPNQLAVSADGRHVFVTLHGADSLAVVDVATRRVAKIIPVGRSPLVPT